MFVELFCMTITFQNAARAGERNTKKFWEGSLSFRKIKGILLEFLLITP